MANVKMFRREDLPEFEADFQIVERVLGFLPNTYLAMAHRPEMIRGFQALGRAIMLDEVVSNELKQLVGHVASLASGCRYCQAHTASMAAHLGASDSKIEALWEFEQSELFTEAERSALRLARDAGQSPNAATYDHFRELRDHYSEEQIVVLVGVIALFGFMNRWHETMATDLEDVPTAYATEHLLDRGWHPGRHGSALR